MAELIASNIQASVALNLNLTMRRKGSKAEGTSDVNGQQSAKFMKDAGSRSGGIQLLNKVGGKFECLLDIVNQNRFSIVNQTGKASVAPTASSSALRPVSSSRCIRI
ncbi:MAG: hypothetical protein ACKFI0_00565 [Candidatus Hodgkinia cicadicola]